jgi:hypothetical protein
MIGTMFSPVGVAGCHGERALATYISRTPPYSPVEEALNRYYPESELSGTAILEPSLQWQTFLLVQANGSGVSL